MSKSRSHESPTEARFWQVAAAIASQCPTRNLHRLYERIKRLYQATHDDVSGADYDAAMSRIAKLAGV